MNTLDSARLIRSRQFVSTAFTLLELLVVISIIAVLAGILIPVGSSVMETARKTTAKNTEMSIITAVKAFQTDYGVYPVPGGTTQTGDSTYDGTKNQDVFNILCVTGVGTDDPTKSPNTRRTKYFEGKDVKNVKVPKDGFLPLTASAVTQDSGTGSVNPGALVDPWGNGYMVRYDTGYDDAVMLPQLEGNTPNSTSDSAGKTTGVLRFGVIAWSYGKDGVPGKKGTTFDSGNGSYNYGDDVVSWQ